MAIGSAIERKPNKIGKDGCHQGLRCIFHPDALVISARHRAPMVFRSSGENICRQSGPDLPKYILEGHLGRAPCLGKEETP